MVVTLPMETPSTPKPPASKKPVYVGNVETTGDKWTDVREATKVVSTPTTVAVSYLTSVEVRGYRSPTSLALVRCPASVAAS